MSKGEAEVINVVAEALEAHREMEERTAQLRARLITALTSTGLLDSFLRDSVWECWVDDSSGAALRAKLPQRLAEVFGPYRGALNFDYEGIRIAIQLYGPAIPASWMLSATRERLKGADAEPSREARRDQRVAITLAALRPFVQGRGLKLVWHSDARHSLAHAESYIRAHTQVKDALGVEDPEPDAWFDEGDEG